MRGRAGGEGKLVRDGKLPEAGRAPEDGAEDWSFSALPILEAFLTPVKNSSIRVSTSLCGLFIGAYF